MVTNGFAMSGYKYIRGVHTIENQLDCDSLADAVFMAAYDYESGDGWPEKIVSPSGFLLWEDSGPYKTGESLKRFAEIHCINWPDV